MNRAALVPVLSLLMACGSAPPAPLDQAAPLVAPPPCPAALRMASTPLPPPPSPSTTPACADGLDNDLDGQIDGDDPGCEYPNDGIEFDPLPGHGQPCANGIDDDGDGVADLDDPGCAWPGDRSEGPDPVQPPVCANGVDDDGDGRIDWPADPDCRGVGDVAEHAIPARLGQLYDVDLRDRAGARGFWRWLDKPTAGTCSDAPQRTAALRITTTRHTKVRLVSRLDRKPALFARADPLDASTERGCSRTGELVLPPGHWWVFQQPPADRRPRDVLFIPLAACANDIDDDGDGAVDRVDTGCLDHEDDDEAHDAPACAEAGIDRAITECPVLGESWTQVIDVAPGQRLSVHSAPGVAIAAGCDGPLLWCHGQPEYLPRPVLDRPGRYRVRLPVRSPDGRRIEPTHLRWAVACGNGLDDDGDGYIDAADPGCHDAHDRSERGPIDSGGALPVCGNGLDDDGDGQIDWPADPQCAARGDDAEGLATDERIFARFRGTGGRALVGPWRERRRFRRTPRSHCPRAGVARYTEVVVERPSRLEAAITHSDRPQSLALRCDPSRSDAAREVTCTAKGPARLVVERIEPGAYPLLVIGASHGRAVVEVRLEPL